jgi:hypothetical protein
VSDQLRHSHGNRAADYAPIEGHHTVAGRARRAETDANLNVIERKGPM